MASICLSFVRVWAELICQEADSCYRESVAKIMIRSAEATQPCAAIKKNQILNKRQSKNLFLMCVELFLNTIHEFIRVFALFSFVFALQKDGVISYSVTCPFLLLVKLQHKRLILVDEAWLNQLFLPLRYTTEPHMLSRVY